MEDQGHPYTGSALGSAPAGESHSTQVVWSQPDKTCCDGVSSVFTRHMDLALNRSLGDRYKSGTQKARVISEAWAETNAYCCSCGGALRRRQNNASVLDFKCADCRGEFELKSKRGDFCRKLPDGAFGAMTTRLSGPCSPDFFFLAYNPSSFQVTNFFAVPSSFLDTTVIEKRKPLSPNARRAGWVGCYILMDRIPEAGKVFYVRNGEILRRSSVLEAWGRTAFLRSEPRPETRGWALEILRNIQSLRTREFSLKEMYGFEVHLKRRFPRNNFIRAKIRQQLQVLRDVGLIVFQGRGRYTTNFQPSGTSSQEHDSQVN
jgi:type II restriction enzyme